MTKMISLLVATIALCSGVGGCARADQESRTAEASEALSSRELEYEYYSDDTYMTLVGAYFASCGGLPSRWGQRTQYIIGSQAACPSGPTHACYEIIDGREYCGASSCVTCF